MRLTRTNITLTNHNNAYLQAFTENDMARFKRTLWAGKILSTLSVIIFIGGLLWGSISKDLFSSSIILCTGLCYGLLAKISAKRPFTAILSGLIVYIVILVMHNWVHPEMIFEGIGIKLFILAIFSRTLYHSGNREGISQVANVEN